MTILSTFISGTTIICLFYVPCANFLCRYLEEELLRENPALAQKTHFFNTFFYERLSQKAADKRYGFALCICSVVDEEFIIFLYSS